MKRLVCVLVVAVMLCALSSGAASVQDFVGSIGGSEIAYSIRDMLLIICKYGKLLDDSSNIARLTEQHKDSLNEYKRILILCIKDDMIYLAIELPLTEGVFTENSGNGLMSSKYILENMRIGN